MTSLLYIGPGAGAEARQWWRKGKNDWESLPGEPGSDVFVVTNLAEENFAEIKSPRLFGLDSSHFLDRQLVARFPETPYRTVVPGAQKGTLMDRIAPTRHLLLGIDAADRLNTELDAVKGAIRGVWPISLLMSELGQSAFLPEDLFVVFPSAHTLRIVFLKNRTPVLTRLTPTPNRVGAQVDEIIRTLRYLENMKLVVRSDKLNHVLLLGDNEGFAAPLAAAKIELVTRRRRERKAMENWLFPIFSRAIKSPAGQVAPLVRRLDFLAKVMRKRIRIGVSLAIVATLGATANQLAIILAIQTENGAVNSSTQQVDQQIAEIDKRIADFGVTADLIRRAISLDKDEVVTAPALDKQLYLIASALKSDSSLRLKDLKWRVLAPGVAPCGTTANPDQAAQAPGTAEPGGEQRKVELNLEVALPDSYGPRDQALTLRNISTDLARIDKLTLWQDPAKELIRGSIQGGTTAAPSARNPSWCMTLPGAPSAAVPTGTPQSEVKS